MRLNKTNVLGPLTRLYHYLLSFVSYKQTTVGDPGWSQMTLLGGHRSKIAYGLAGIAHDDMILKLYRLDAYSQEKKGF